MVPRFFKKNIFLLGILALAIFLRFYRLPELMVFGGDVARDYLVARDITLKGEIPLVGSPTSVPWLHQGAFFTYLLGIVLWLGKYNPVVGGYFVGALGSLGVLGIYFLGKEFFSEKAGLVSAFFYATSPLVVIFDRYPYHQSLISLFTMVFFWSLYKSFSNYKFLVFSAFVFGLLMQLELSNLILLPIILLVILKERAGINLKKLVLCFLAFFITWLPKVIYDFSNGWTQTIGFVAWIIHKIIPVHFAGDNPSLSLPIFQRFIVIFNQISKMIFWPSSVIAGLILILLAGLLFKKAKEIPGKFLLILWLAFPMIGFLIQGSPSESYMPVLFAVPALLVGWSVSLERGALSRLGILAAVALGIFNAYFLISNNFFVLTEKPTGFSQKYNQSYSFRLRKEIAQYLITDTKGLSYNLIPLGSYGYYPSGKLDLVYLTWYLGNEPKENKEGLVYYAFGVEDNIRINKNWQLKSFPYLVIAKKTQ